MSEAWAVARVVNKYGDLDFLCGWHGRWGTVASGAPNALRFPSEAVAIGAATRAARLVPRWIYGDPIAYRVVPHPAARRDA